MRSSFPAENGFESSHSRQDLIVRRSSIVICSVGAARLQLELGKVGQHEIVDRAQEAAVDVDPGQHACD
ncbi:MAG TPA: hypothetical protein VHW64_14665 [Nocardioides sp.]|jgi:hypothetical protein|uniref:hypothetical protein n=1 Tax=Nocardioides sp. TaxID=35761 RepID=UPI002E37B873|nr:hypothetical protein [Nocardioides sp.]HEX3931944.1 hypothetical protein [Nocardioides sp.]